MQHAVYVCADGSCTILSKHLSVFICSLTRCASVMITHLVLTIQAHFT